MLDVREHGCQRNGPTKCSNRVYVVSQAQAMKMLSIEIKAGRSITVGTNVLSETKQYKGQSVCVL